MLHISKFRRSLDIITNNFAQIIADLEALPNAQRPVKTNQALSRLYDEINLSILSGEYIENDELTKKEVENAKVNLTILLTQIEQDVNDGLLIEVFYNFITVVENCLDSYSMMMMRVNNILSINNGIFLNNDYDRDEIKTQCIVLLNKHKKITYTGFDEKKTLKAYEVLIINIHTSLIDLSCNPNEKLLYKLNFIEDNLNNLYSDIDLKAFEFIFSIREKVKYLKVKVIIRLFQRQKELGSNLSIIQNLTITTLQNLIDNVQFVELRDFLEYTNNHYIEGQDNEQAILYNYRNSYNRSDNYLFRHLKIKYYKDLKKDKLSLTNIVNQCDTDFRQVSSKFDHFAKGVCANYANNNLFSFELDNDKLPIETAFASYERVKGLSIETGIKNYFPELRFLKFLIKKLNILFAKESIINDVAEINSLLKTCNELIDSYKKNINWTKHNHSYIYQLPFDECKFVNAFTKKARLRHFFTASTIVLPLDKEKDKADYLEYFNQIKVFDSIKNTVNNLAVESQKLAKLNDSIESKDVKYIEILGIFCAVSTFVSAAIISSIADKGNQISEGSSSINFLLSTGIVLFSFLGLIVYIFNKKSVSKKFSLVLVIILVLMLITCNNIGRV